jgi:hypothetical protein
MISTSRILSFQIVFFLLFYSHAFAQLDNTPLADRIELKQQDSNTIGFSVSNFNYLRNTEYFNNIELGRTLFGITLNPSLFIQPSPLFRIQAGVFVRSDFGGNPSFTKILPTISLKIKKNNWSVLFGTLEGALAHRLYEPIFDIGSAIERRIENGFQIKHESKRQFFDAWINWERFIERKSPFKEQLTAGVNYMPNVLSDKSSFALIPIAQALIYHRGGQIDTDTSNMIVAMNGVAGLKIQKNFPDARFVRSVALDVAGLVYNERTNSSAYPFRQGSGFISNATVASKSISLMLSYWNASSFIAPRGTAIYQSVSIDKPAYTENVRSLLFVRLLYAKQIQPGLFVSARAEPFYDLRNKILDYSYSVYITFSGNYFISKIKPIR